MWLFCVIVCSSYTDLQNVDIMTAHWLAHLNENSSLLSICDYLMCFVYTAELARALQETEHLLGEISVMTRKQAPAVEQCAKVLSSTEDIVEQEVSSLSR